LQTKSRRGMALKPCWPLCWPMLAPLPLAVTGSLCLPHQQPYPTLPQETEAAASKQHAAAVQGLEQLRDTLAAKAAEAERKIERANKKASKMPELAQMLAPFLG